MKINKFSALIISICFSGLSIFLLFVFSKMVNQTANGFIRLFRPHTVRSIKSLNLRYNSFYFAGTIPGKIYLGNVTTPFNLYWADTMLKEIKKTSLNFDTRIISKLKSVKLEVDSPAVFLKDGLSTGIFTFSLNDSFTTNLVHDSIYFTGSAALSKSSFVLRTTNNGADEYILAKEQQRIPHTTFFPGLINKQADGFFSTDGMLLYNKQAAKLIYVYYYRNQFICMDSSLALQYNGKTIDTISWAKIHVIKINSNKTMMMNSPPLLVNKKACTYGSLLFINSNLPANNEDKESFSGSSVIDVYNINNGSYKFSFYLDDFGSKKIKDIAVYNNCIYTIHDQYLVLYFLDPKIFI